MQEFLNYFNFPLIGIIALLIMGIVWKDLFYVLLSMFVFVLYSLSPLIIVTMLA